MVFSAVDLTGGALLAVKRHQGQNRFNESSKGRGISYGTVQSVRKRDEDEGILDRGTVGSREGRPGRDKKTGGSGLDQWDLGGTANLCAPCALALP